MEEPKKDPEIIDPRDNNASLETKETTVDPASQDGALIDARSEEEKKAAESAPEDPKAKKKKKGLTGVFGKTRRFVNIYLVIFFLIIMAGLAITVVTYYKQNKEEDGEVIKTQNLDEATKDNLTGNETKVGDPKELLSIESNTVFNGKVLVKDTLEVAGAIKVGGAIDLPGITVSGSSTFDNVNIKNLQISGDTAIQGQLTVQKGANISGNATFSGNVTISNLTVERLNLSSDLGVNRHIDAGGPTPNVASGSGVGNGGTVSISGSDTAGTVTVNTGTGPAAGVLATVTFVHKYSGNPHVVVTPIGSDAAGLNYYLNRDLTGFSVATTNAAPAGKSFSFDYIVID